MIMVDVREYNVRSSDGVHELNGRLYIPLGEIKGFFQVVHGMTEHIERYHGFLQRLAEEGWLAFAYDHLGHGRTAINDDELGFIASKNGWDILARDVKAYSDAVISEYGKVKLPYVLMGHSMGSFIVRLASQKYVKPDKLIVMGTGGKNGAAGAGIAVASVISLFRGEKHISPLMYKLAFGSYNSRFGGGTEDDPSPWLTTDEEVRKKYYADKYCTFKFTVSAMRDLITLNKECNGDGWFEGISKKLPILLLSGEDDPVGDYGKGVTEVYEKLKEKGCKVDIKLYKGVRHEPLNDSAREECISDILNFVG